MTNNVQNNSGITFKQALFHPITIIVLLIVFFPIGLLLMWIGKVWPVWIRVSLTVFLGLVLVMSLSNIKQNDMAKNMVNTEASIQESVSYLIDNDVATKDLLYASAPKNEENRAYFKGRVKNVYIDTDKLADDSLVIVLNMQYDTREEFELTSDYYDKKIIMEVMNNALKYLVEQGHDPSKHGFDVRVSGNLESFQKSPTGKPIIESRGVARYSGMSDRITYKNRDW